jgi:DNA-binding CsgD family transcriptional regulator
MSSLWEAAIDPARWSEALDLVGVAAGGAGASVLSPNPAVGCLVNKDLQEAFDLYFKEGWCHLDLRRRGLVRLMHGEVLGDDDVVTPSDIAASPYYSEFLPRIGIKWWMGIGFNSGENFYCLAVQSGRRHEAFTSEDKAIFKSIRPQLSHLGRLVDMTRRSVVGSTLSTLKGLSEAAICIGADGKVVDTNQLAERLFDDEFGIQRGKIFLHDPRAREEFALALTASLSSAGHGGFVVVVRPDRHPLLIRFVALHPAAQSTFFGAAVLLIAKEIASSKTVNGAILTKAYGLTPAESRLASLLADGLSLEDIADMLAISKETARNQLKAVFAKTRTHRQGQLVSVLVAAR